MIDSRGKAWGTFLKYTLMAGLITGSYIPVLLFWIFVEISWPWFLFFNSKAPCRKQTCIEIACTLWKTIKDSFYCFVQYLSFKDQRNKILSSELERISFLRNRCTVTYQITAISLNTLDFYLPLATKKIRTILYSNHYLELSQAFWKVPPSLLVYLRAFIFTLILIVVSICISYCKLQLL